MESESLSLEPDFIEDVGKRLEKEDITDVNEMINRLNKRYTLIRNAEHTTLQQRQRLQTKEKYLKDTLACVRMLLQRREKGEDTIVDYGLSGVLWQYPANAWYPGQRFDSAASVHSALRNSVRFMLHCNLHTSPLHTVGPRPCA